jgi:GNAT superfamily N-acetyltransferase
MIRALTSTDRSDALHVINTAARWYREFLHDEETHDPEMTAADWDRESQRMTWYGAFEAQSLIGVAALEYIKDVALLRHAYILPEWQRQGTGSLLTRALEGEVASGVRIVIGTYRANYKARGALSKLGYSECADSEAMLRAYYCIPEDRLRASVTYEKLRR